MLVALQECPFCSQRFAAASAEPEGAAVVVHRSQHRFDTAVLFQESGLVLQVPALAILTALAKQGLRRFRQVFFGMIEIHQLLIAVESLVVVGIVPQGAMTVT